MKHIEEDINKKKEKDLHNELLARKIRKGELMMNFMANFNLEVLYDTYLRVFYRYSPELGNTTYTCIRKSFVPHLCHISPYYTKDKILKLGMNQGIIEFPKKRYIYRLQRWII